MTKNNRNIILLLSFFVVIASAILYFGYLFLSALKPIKVTITEDKISSSKALVNPIIIERIKVDSFGNEGFPARYRIEYLTMCSLKKIREKPPVGLKTISLNEPGRYTWSEEIVNIPMTHENINRTRKDSIEGIIWPKENSELAICPIKFERNNWYFINFLEPTIIGIYINVDKNGILHQFDVYNRVSPI